MEGHCRNFKKIHKLFLLLLLHKTIAQNITYYMILQLIFYNHIIIMISLHQILYST